jgi:hypothetical protein
LELNLREEDQRHLRETMGDEEFETHYHRGLVHPEIDGAERALNSVR